MRHRQCLPLMALVGMSLVLAVFVPVANAQDFKGQAEGVESPRFLGSIDSKNQKELEVFQVPFAYEGYIQGNFPEPMLIQVEEGPFWVQVQQGGGPGAVYVVPPGGRPQRVKPIDASQVKFPDGYVEVQSGSAIVLTGQADVFC